MLKKKILPRSNNALTGKIMLGKQITDFLGLRVGDYFSLIHDLNGNIRYVPEHLDFSAKDHVIVKLTNDYALSIPVCYHKLYTIGSEVLLSTDGQNIIMQKAG